MLATIVLINEWRRLAKRLAQLDTIQWADLKAKLVRAEVPRELWPRMHAVIGRHRHQRYHDAPGLTDDERDELAVLTIALESKPVAQWGDDDHAKEERAVQLRTKLHGPLGIRQINKNFAPGGLRQPGAVSLAASETLPFPKGLSTAFDTWGARQHDDVSVVTFRRWRRMEERRPGSLLHAMKRMPSHGS